MAAAVNGADDTAELLRLVLGEAERYLAALAEAPVLDPHAAAARPPLGGPLPEDGEGALSALRRLLESAPAGAPRSAGPRFFHFVTGGVTPAALAADWLVSLLDQNAFSSVSSPVAAELERTALAWLGDLFRLPKSHGGVFTSGATSANLTGLAAARRFCGERLGVDVDRDGLFGLPPIPVFASGFLHASVLRALGVLGLGRGSVRVVAVDGGPLDLAALERGLRACEGGPAIVVATAGDVNTGAFDPIAGAADLAGAHRAWLHVDGAFGLYARLAPAAAHLAAGIERAASVASDGHKWLNVPYDSGFAFVADAELLQRTFAAGAAYLPGADPGHVDFGQLGPDLSRRARGIVAWATLAAYGRRGYRELVERHLALACRLAARVDAAPELERLAEAPLNVVCFRYRRPGAGDAELDALNEALGTRILADGRVYAGTTRHLGRTALRPAIVNWRTREADVDLLVDVVLELAAAL